MECLQLHTLVMVLIQHLIIAHVGLIPYIVIITASKMKQRRQKWDSSIVGIISALQAISAG